MTRSLSETLGGGAPGTWARDFLIVAQLPVTAENVRVVYFWEYAESGGGGGMWNPLNTTQQWPGATNANSVGVKNYARRSDGLGANARVIRNGLYGPVIAAFERGDDAAATVAAITSSPWGTRHINLGGGGGSPPPPPPPPPPKVRVMPCIISNDHGGYWIVKADGAVESFGGAEFHGSIFGRLPEGRTITSAVGTPSGHGYWLISDVGNVYAFGDAQWHGNA